MEVFFWLKDTNGNQYQRWYTLQAHFMNITAFCCCIASCLWLLVCSWVWTTNNYAQIIIELKTVAMLESQLSCLPSQVYLHICSYIPLQYGSLSYNYNVHGFTNNDAFSFLSLCGIMMMLLFIIEELINDHSLPSLNLVRNLNSNYNL